MARVRFSTGVSLDQASALAILAGVCLPSQVHADSARRFSSMPPAHPAI